MTMVRTPAEALEHRPKISMVRISATWPMLITGIIQFL